jgi:catechol 2,3-dioxygenase-like lactoylglutathione lyase family enzyme
MITGTDFASIPTRDVEAAATFYRETLGLPNPVHRPERGFSEFETGNLTVSTWEP